MAIGIDPLVDYAFKMLFGRTDYKILTISPINTVLDGQPLVPTLHSPTPSKTSSVLTVNT